ncbi:hypothetical protein NDU88_007113 [Pleurodeles waltl]|uniref:Integrase catalytic domain-containing protein n=1 Tax=Pleurodeles waltl TaxID=8319 RepID=A0AAV7UMY2_PLEWA|nr:hypothetical protein NDU88_007113 [Pleurodeles waltl]
MNAGKGTVVNLSHIGRAGGPFSRMQLDFIEMPVCGSLKYVLVIVCIFSHWIEAYPTRRNDSLPVAKLLLREVIPRFGFLISLESDRGSHFNNEVDKLLSAALNIEQKLHCSYRPEASGVVEQMNGTLKSRMAKMCAATNLKWPDALPLVLMLMRNTPNKKTQLSPHEILMGRAMRLPAVPANALVNITDDMVLDYCKGLADVVHSFSHQVEATTLSPINDPGHNLKAGDWVVIKKHSAGIPNWIHASHTKKVTCPTDEEVELLKVPTTEKEVSGPESDQRGTETEGEPGEDGLVTPVRDEGEETQMGDGEPISTEGAGEPNQREVLLEADDYGNELECVTDSEGEGVEVEESQSVQTPPEQIAGPSRENTIEPEDGKGLPQVRSRTRETLKGDKWPELQVKRGEVVVEDAIEEEVDTMRREDLSEGELQGDRKLKRKRVANKRHAGPEGAYAAIAEWQQEFLPFCFDREIPGQYFGTLV